MKVKRIVRITILLILILIHTGTVFAQTEQLSLRMSRDWGYGGFNGEIQGLFSMRVTGPSDLAGVDYFIDDTKIGKISEAPFNLQFSTDDYPLGSHKLYAIGHSSTGQEYRSNVITANFVPKQSSMKFILPVLGVVLGAALLSTLVPFLTGRRKRISIPMGAERHYGVGGGGICPNCHRPFALPLFSMHLGFSKLALCPFCSKLGLVRVESIGKLREAEKTELEWVKTDEPPRTNEEEELRKDLDDSKYLGL